MDHVAKRRQEEKERRRAEILDAAESVATMVGWDGITMDQVARKARLSRALLYVYFTDKTDLMFGICERALATLNKRFEQAVSRNKYGIDQLGEIGRAYFAFSNEFPVHFHVIARCELLTITEANVPANERACLVVNDTIRSLVLSVLETGVRDGSVRVGTSDLKPVAYALWGLSHGLLQLVSTKGELLARDGLESRRLLEVGIDLIVRSMAATGAHECGR